jgi:hypothetical protein
MRVDLFLSTLLFGVTLVTFGIAFAHLAGNSLMGKSHTQPLLRKILYSNLLSFFITLSLLVTLTQSFRVIGDKKVTNIWTALWKKNVESVFSPKLISKKNPTTAQENSSEDITQIKLRSDGKATVFQAASEETLSALHYSSVQAMNLPPFVALFPADAAPDCLAWASELQEMGAIVSRPYAKGQESLDSIFLVCALNSLSDRDWEKTLNHLQKGGGLFYIGATKSKNDKHASRIFGVEQWHNIESDTPVSIVFGSEFLTFGGFPAGLKLNLGQSWQQRSDGAFSFAQTMGGEGIAVQSSGLPFHESQSSSLLMRSFAKGRVAWTSLPAQLYGKSHYLYEHYWKLLKQRLIAHLARIPVVGLEPWPSGTEATTTLGVNAEYEFLNAENVMKILSAQKIPVTFYPTSSESLTQESTTLQLYKNRTAFGSRAFDHASQAGKDYLSQRQDMLRWSATHASFLQKSGLKAESEDAFAKKKCCELGYLTTAQDADADTLAAAARSPVNFVIGDPYADRLEPYLATQFSTDTLRTILGDWQTWLGAQAIHQIVVVPSVLNDIEMHDPSKPEPEKRVVANYLQACKQLWSLKGACHLTIHTQFLGAPRNRSILSSILTELKNEGAQFVTLSESVKWWADRSQVRVQTLKEDSKWFVTLQNTGTEELKNAVLRMTEAQAWQLKELSKMESAPRSLSSKTPSETSQDAKILRLEIEKLAPGQILTFALERFQE